MRMNDSPRQSKLARLRQRRRDGDRGAALVEFALLLPFLAVLTFGTIDLGRAFYMWNEVKAAAREGAHYAQQYPYRLRADGTSTRCANPHNVEFKARLEAGNTAGATLDITTHVFKDGMDITPTVTCAQEGATPEVPDEVAVTVERQLTLYTPLIAGLVPDPWIRSTVRVNVQDPGDLGS